MKNLLFLGFFCLLTFASCTQVKRADQILSTESLAEKTQKPTTFVTIQGKITGQTLVADSIFFVTDWIDQKYFDVPIPPASITNNSFTIETAVTYPQMRRIVFKSDWGKRVYRRGVYFIDASTRTLTADYLAEECNQINGETAAEYRNQFIPFFYPAGATPDCHQQGFDILRWDKATRYDSTLYAYVNVHPSSYVALWSLIERFSQFGHSQVREQTVARFSERIQASRLWQTLRDDMRNTPIKQGVAFPSFSVKGVSQPEHKLQLPKAQYTLVDFWFSRCRPCLESFPALKKLYATYQAQGFEIVSISTDRTADVPVWHKRIKEYELPWVQYLDENDAVSVKLSISVYPTTFLLDHTGNVLLRDITPEELEKFLAANLRK